ADGERAAAAAAKASEAERERLAAALQERSDAADRLGAEIDAATAKGARLAADLDAARARLAEAEALLSRSEAAREEALLENGRQFARIAERDAALREAAAAKRDLADRLSALATEHAVAQGTLLAQRAERVDWRREVGPSPALHTDASLVAGSPSDQALRRAISSIGRKMARLNDKAPMAEAEPSNLVSFDRLEAHAHPAGSSETMHSAPAGKVRQGQPMAPER